MRGGVCGILIFEARGIQVLNRIGDTVINRRALLLTLASAFLIPPTAQAAGGAEQYVQSIGKDVLALANGSVRGKPLRAKFTGLLGRHVNLRTIAGSALGTYRSKLPPADREKFNTLVTTYAAALFVWYIDKFKGAEFVVDSVVQQGNFTIVKSKIAKSKISNEPIVWYLAPKGSGFQVVDLSILGVRLSVAMRDAFSRELKKSKGNFNSLYAFLAEAETW
jgi:phospholipid transport system substrate-binding protein